MTFRENLNRICKENGTTLTQTMKELGVSTSKVTAINKGSIPSEAMLLDLAGYLHCSVMDFFADEGDLKPLETLNEDESDLIRVYRSLPRRAKHELMAMVYEFENRNELEGDKTESEAI